MSGEELARTAIEGNMMDRMEALEAKVESILNSNVRSGSLDMLVEDTDLVGYRLIAVPNDATQLEPTASDFTGAFLAGLEQIMNDLTQDAWLAKINAGEVEFSVGIEGIYQNRLTNGYKHIADDGTTFRKGELGMTTLEGQSAPSFGLTYSDNSVSSELVTNGGFETGDFTGWTANSGSGWSISTVGSYNGTYCAKSVSSGDKSQNIDITGGDIFNLEVYGLSSAASRLRLLFYTGAGASGTFISDYNVIFNTVGAFYRRTIISPPNASSVQVKMLVNTGETATFDSISLKLVTVSNYLGFEASGKLVSRILSADNKIGQVPIGDTNIPRVDEAKDKLTVSLSGVGVNTTGVKGFVTTFVDQYGETDADLSQATSFDVSSSNRALNLSTVPIGKWGTLSRNIYMTVAGATQTDPAQYYLAATINDNTATTGSINLSDATLVTNAQLPTINTTGSRPAFPKRWMCFGDDIITSVTMVQNLTAGSTQRYGFISAPTAANANDGDLYYADIFIEAGTYTFSHYGQKSSDAGKIDYYIDNVLVQSGVDWYAGVSTANQTESFSVTIPTPGYHILEMKVNGKNASSSDYRAWFTKLSLKPAAY